jgi:hypothetical protein
VILSLVGVVVAGFLAVLLFGLLTGRIEWRQQACCQADPDKDGRMHVPQDRSAGLSSAAAPHPHDQVRRGDADR